MTADPKFGFYWPTECRSDREELRPIWGESVHIVDRTQSANGEWQYKVYGSPEQPDAFFNCFESELFPYRGNIVAQSAELRQSVKEEGLRTLLRQRGYDPLRCVQVACDQGDDVHKVLILSDGTIVDIEYLECPRTRQAVSFSRWDVTYAADEEIEVRCHEDSEHKLARELVTREPDASELDNEIRAYFDKHLAADDRPLPPCLG